MKIKKRYKVRNKSTGLFWLGYGTLDKSYFNRSGKGYSTYDAAVNAINKYANRWHSTPNFVSDWDRECEIVEYEIRETESTQLPIGDKLREAQFIEHLSTKVNYYFAYEYGAMVKKGHSFKYAIHINGNFPEVRAQLKMLGYNARQYKKTYNLLWVDNEDIIVKLKLLDGVRDVYNIEELRQEFENTR